ncbi:MAG: tetratricopeptide repeat protein [Candidatus Eremiobacteraeota bacterium]|nr:tetratricopeptide repeat protein [Candidatus Eremiobacteraeota bacterium]
MNNFIENKIRTEETGWVLKILAVSMILFLFSGCTRESKPPGQIWSSSPADPAGTPTEDFPDTLRTLEDVKKGLERGNLDIEKAWIILKSHLDKSPGAPSLLFLKARLLWQMGKFDESLRELDQVISKEPENAGALAFKARILLDLFRNEEAEKTINRLEKIDPGDAWYNLLKARVMIRTRDYEMAEKLLKKYINKNPDHIEAYLELIDVYAESDRIDDGIRFIRGALKRSWPDPKKDRSRLLTRLGEFVERQGKEEEALRYIQKALELDPDNPDARGRSAMRMMDLADPVKFRAEVERAVKTELNSPFPLYALAKLHYNDGRLSLGKSVLYRAIEKFPLEIMGYNTLGYLTLDFKEYREAQLAYTKARIISPGNYDALMGEALLALVRRDFESARKILSSIDIPEHRLWEHNLRLGDIYMDHLRDYSTARKYFDRALFYANKGGDPVVPLINLGYIELGYKNDRKAEEYFHRALEEEDISIYAGILIAVIENQRLDMARKYLAEWEKLNSSWSPRDISTIYLGCDDSYLSIGAIDESIVMIEKAKKADPEDPMIHNHLGKILYIQGDNKGAKSSFESCVEKYPDEAYSWFFLGLIAEEEGDDKRAEYCYDMARKYFRSPGDIDFQKAWIYSAGRRRDAAISSLKKACEKDIFNACRAYSDVVFNWMRDDKFFKQELPELIKQVKDKTPPPPGEEIFDVEKISGIKDN